MWLRCGVEVVRGADSESSRFKRVRRDRGRIGGSRDPTMCASPSPYSSVFEAVQRHRSQLSIGGGNAAVWGARVKRCLINPNHHL